MDASAIGFCDVFARGSVKNLDIFIDGIDGGYIEINPFIWKAKMYYFFRRVWQKLGKMHLLI